MKQHLIQNLRRFSFLLPLRSLIALTQQPVFLPFYHAVQGKEPLPHIHNLYTLRTEVQFEDDLDYLLRHFKPVSLQELYEIILGKRQVQTPVFHLTFDDGLREVFDIAAPVLKRKGVSATIFLNSSFVDNRGLFFRYKVSLLLEKLSSPLIIESQLSKVKEIMGHVASSRLDIPRQLLGLRYQDQQVIDQLAEILECDFAVLLEEKRPYLMSSQIKSLQADGFTFGAHSVDHPQYNQLPLKEQLSQTTRSVQFVADHFHPQLNCFSFPFTDDGIGQDFFTQLNEKSITQLTFGCAGLKKDSAPRHLQRFPMEGTREAAANLIKAEYAYYLIKGLFNKNKIIRS